MPTGNAMLHIRVDTELKKSAQEVLDGIGLSTSEAVRLLFYRIAVDQAFPLELKVPSAEGAGSKRAPETRDRCRSLRQSIGPNLRG